MINYNFEWDPNKARSNQVKHGISFEEAATVFRDPRALSIFDDEHISNEDRWITIGISNTGRLVVVCHTFQKKEESNVAIRLFSSRKANKKETVYLDDDVLEFVEKIAKKKNIDIQTVVNQLLKTDINIAEVMQ